MNEKLMQFPNKMFYENKLKADESVKNIKLSDLIGEKT
jgi:superfamily I DNA and/or RNA helicase